MLYKITETFDNNYKRCEQLIEVYKELGGHKKGKSTTQQSDLLRATVVFIHATLEEFLRGLTTMEVALYK